MNTELEQRLRADLPRLADLIAQAEDDAPAVAGSGAQRRRTPRAVAAAAVAVVAVAVSGVAVAVSRGHDSGRSASNGTVVVTGSWRALAPSIIGPRGNAVVAWTGREVIVWGGYRGDPRAPLALQQGETYEPATNTWRKISDNGWAHPGATGVWATDRLYVLAKTGGAVYVPATDTWHEIARLPEDHWFFAATWSGSQLFALVGGPDPASIAVARYDASRDTWSIGKTAPEMRAASSAHPSAVWTGNEIAVSDGRRSTSRYDPGTNTWGPRLDLDARATASSIANMDGTLVAVYSDDGGHLRAARAVENGWRDIADAANVAIADPVVVAGGGTIFVIDPAGRVAPMRVDEASRRWVPLAGFPLPLGASAAAVWAGTGLFVWDGVPPGTPASFVNPAAGKLDAAWYGA